MKNIINGYQSPGSIMPMPAKGGNNQLTNTDIESVLKFMKQKFNPQISQ